MLAAYIDEVLPLFPDEYFMVTGDETHAIPPCSHANTAGLEAKLRAHVRAAGKQFCGAEEMGQYPLIYAGLEATVSAISPPCGRGWIRSIAAQ